MAHVQKNRVAEIYPPFFQALGSWRDVHPGPPLMTLRLSLE